MPRIVCAALLLVVAGASAQQRAIKPADFDSWRTLNGQVLSHDGHYLAYGLFPQEGDGQVVVRDLKTGVETKQPAGQLPAPAPDDPTAEAPPPPRAIRLTFAGDSTVLVFLAYPDRATVEKAKTDKSVHPHESLVILNLATGKPTVIADVKSVQLPDKSDAYLAYQMYGAPAPAAEAKPAAPADDEEEDQRGARAGAGAARGGAAEYGSTVVLRKLSDGTERSFPDVLEYQLTKDGKLLAYSVASAKVETDGVFAVASAGGEPKAVFTGKGRYEHLTFDEKQTELAFVGNPAPVDARKPPYSLYLWKTSEPAAVLVVSAATPGFHAGWVVSNKGALTFSKDGSRLFFGAGPVPPPAHATAIDEDKPSFDLWNYKDEQIQSIQKVRATADLNRSYRAVYLVPQRKMIQLADDTMTELQPNAQGRYALGTSDKEYRAMTDYGVRLSDTYLVDLETGQRTLLTKKHEGRMQWSGDGRYAVLFDGKDWNSIAVPSGKTANLTVKIPVKFFNEENDTPSTPGSYGLAGWTKDDKHVLLYDHWDIWQVSPDGLSAANLTAGFGRAQHLELRYVRLAPESDTDTRTIDPAQPLLLRAEDTVSHDSGYYVTRVDAKVAPTKLLMTATDVSMPIKAKNADVYVFSEQTFTQFPNLLVTNSTFANPQRVTDANPQQTALAWGTDELVNFESLDGIPLQGILYKPANFDPHKHYPMIVYLYEKLSQNVHHFVDPRPMDSINISTYVSNGYLVFTPDIVYTTGYPGQSALKCVMAGVNSIVALGFVDEKNIGIQGHSWGGYQIAYMVTQTTRFKAAEDGAPVVNMISAYDGIRWGAGIPRQFQYEKTQSRIGGTPWQYPLRYIENSPIFMVDKITTPLLILHNDADDAVPWYQGIEFYLALRRLGKEAYMYTYNGEPHHLRRRPNQKDYAVRMMQFFDYELKGATKPVWMEKGVPYLHTPEEFAPEQFAPSGGK